jgi:hypothetical protein
MRIDKRTRDGADMSATKRPRLVAGERVEALLPALRAIMENAMLTGDGMFEVEVSLADEDAEPLMRALMRLEARLLREDANRLNRDGVAVRASERRRADAMGLLLQHAAAALVRQPRIA